MRRHIDTGTLVDLIAAGLPEFILNRIDREILSDAVDLFNEVSKCKHMVNKKNFIEKKITVILKGHFKKAFGIILSMLVEV